MIETSILNQFSSKVKIALHKLDEDNQIMFVSEFKRKRKGLGAAYLWSLLFSPAALFLYVGRTGLFWIFLLVCLLTAGIGGLIWYVIELFLIPKRIREYNEDLAVDLIRDQKMLAG